MKYVQTLVILFLTAAFFALDSRGQDRKDCATFSYILTNGIPQLASVWPSICASNVSIQNRRSLYSNAKMRHTKEMRGDGSGYWVIKAEYRKPLRGTLDNSFSSLSDQSAIRALEDWIYTYTEGPWQTMEAQYEMNANGTNAIVFLFGDHRESSFSEWNAVTLYNDGSVERNEFNGYDLIVNSWCWYYPRNISKESTNGVARQAQGSGILLRHYFNQCVPPWCNTQITVDQRGRLAGEGVCFSQTEPYGGKAGLEISLDDARHEVNSIRIYDPGEKVVAIWDRDAKPIDMGSDTAATAEKKQTASENKIQGVFVESSYSSYNRIVPMPLCLFKKDANDRIDTSFPIVPNLEGQPYAYGVQIVFSKDGKKVDKIEVYRDGKVVAFWGNGVRRTHDTSD